MRVSVQFNTEDRPADAFQTGRWGACMVSTAFRKPRTRHLVGGAMRGEDVIAVAGRPICGGDDWYPVVDNDEEMGAAIRKAKPCAKCVAVRRSKLRLIAFAQSCDTWVRVHSETPT